MLSIYPHYYSVVKEIVSKRPETVLDEDEDGNTPLHLACIHGFPNVAKALITAKADIEARYCRQILLSLIHSKSYHFSREIFGFIVQV